ncbi:MAG: 4-(cytidine 5'-diphospho)-2-C-methyl-D-erythritol kinase [Candidatus Eisenbacteria bacterium]|nr:4-(cytidine 5'-diphospho)-2-C-methyl-D-erythritol kinase [Candidatus Latescibacterota bacterium]MBD3301091.1 4-(cytidine 5'-diphospho)-2-C-methyl-D-erythritol kinase [Candidatus Eisenbacteria bacterium]
MRRPSSTSCSGSPVCSISSTSRADPPDRLVLRARAKINLGLEVVRRREDGYHEIRSLMQSVGLEDRLTLVRAADRRIRLRCPDSDLPVDDRNLVVRAAALLRRRTGARAGARIRLEKRIPVGGGLGGGSSDAAATLVGLNRLWRTGLRPGELEALGAELGADVPFHIRGGSQLAEGIGERLTPLPALPLLPVLLVHPNLFVSTGSIYASPRIQLTGFGPLTRLRHCNLATRSGAVSCVARLKNDLEPATCASHPRIDRLRRQIGRAGPGVVRVSGSGSCLFVLSESPEGLRNVLGRLELADCQVYWAWFRRKGWISVGS